MIELLVANRCTGCNICVETCPAGVFERTEAVPRIARPDDCQTCFMCELYCRADALYVAPDCEGRVVVDEAQIVASGALGQLRRQSGWDEWQDDPAASNDHWRMEAVFARAAALNAVRR